MATEHFPENMCGAKADMRRLLVGVTCGGDSVPMKGAKQGTFTHPNIVVLCSCFQYCLLDTSKGKIMRGKDRSLVPKSVKGGAMALSPSTLIYKMDICG